MRIAVAQINTTLGQFQKNSHKIIDYISRAKERYCDIVVFPESTIFGYHPFDLLERVSLVEDQLKELAKICKSIPQGMVVVVGVITKNPSKKGRPYFNSAAILQKGKKPKFFNKELLPTGDVFDEARFIETGSMKNNFFTHKGKKIFVTICEDIWAWPDKNGHSQYAENPLKAVKKTGVDLILNISASPFYPKKIDRRKELVKQTAKLFGAPMIYCNLVGAQDEIIFDGGSFAMNPSGKILMQSLTFEEDINVLDLKKMEGGIHPSIEDETETIRRALVLGLRDFVEKTGLQRVHLGLSGGVDSALVACLAVDALGPDKVKAFGLPGPFNEAESLTLAERLAENLRIDFKAFPISDIYKTAKDHVDKIFAISEFGVIHENLQARLRGLILMAYSNSANSLLLTTGNKSEYAAGYTTLYGDMCGGLAPIADLVKGQVYALCEKYNQESEIIPRRILTRPPSAELKPGQKDQDTLPPYDNLDASVVRLIEKCEKVRDKTDKWLLPVLMRSEFKRWQAPPILKVSEHSFGRGRRLPVAQKASET